MTERRIRTLLRYESNVDETSKRRFQEAVASKRFAIRFQSDPQHATEGIELIRTCQVRLLPIQGNSTNVETDEIWEGRIVNLPTFIDICSQHTTGAGGSNTTWQKEGNLSQAVYVRPLQPNSPPPVVPPPGCVSIGSAACAREFPLHSSSVPLSLIPSLPVSLHGLTPPTTNIFSWNYQVDKEVKPVDASVQTVCGVMQRVKDVKVGFRDERYSLTTIDRTTGQPLEYPVLQRFITHISPETITSGIRVQEYCFTDDDQRKWGTLMILDMTHGGKLFKTETGLALSQLPFTIDGEEWLGVMDQSSSLLRTLKAALMLSVARYLKRGNASGAVTHSTDDSMLPSLDSSAHDNVTSIGRLVPTQEPSLPWGSDSTHFATHGTNAEEQEGSDDDSSDSDDDSSSSEFEYAPAL